MRELSSYEFNIWIGIAAFVILMVSFTGQPINYAKQGWRRVTWRVMFLVIASALGVYMYIWKDTIQERETEMLQA